MIKGPPNPRDLGYYVSLAQVGLEMVAPAGLGVVLDHYLNWSPWGVIVGAIFGLIAGLGHLIALSNRRKKNADSSSLERKDS